MSKPAKGYFTGVTGRYLVAAELSRQQFIVSPTSRSAQTADLLVTGPMCKRTYAVQVKTNGRGFRFWLVNAKTQLMVSRNLVYVLVNLRKTGPEFFVVPSAVLAKRVRKSPPSETRKGDWYSVYTKDVAKYKDCWTAFKKEEPKESD